MVPLGILIYIVFFLIVSLGLSFLLKLILVKLSKTKSVNFASWVAAAFMAVFMMFFLVYGFINAAEADKHRLAAEAQKEQVDKYAALAQKNAKEANEQTAIAQEAQAAIEAVLAEAERQHALRLECEKSK